MTTRPRSKKAKTPLPSPPAPRVVLAYDPGVEGACVALSLDTNAARFWRVRPKRLDKFPVMSLRAVLQAFQVPPVCYVEHVQGRGGWSAQSNFSFGAITGGAISLMREYGWDVRLVKPQAWQAKIHAQVPDLAKGLSAKERSLAAYRFLFPSQPLPLNQVGDPENNTIDALLLAYYGVMELDGGWRDWKFQKGGK